MLESDVIRDLIRQYSPDFRLLSDDELQASQDETLAEWDGKSTVWVFGYGSLIWNPCFDYVDRRKGKIHGYHRAFSLWTPVGRGSPDNPGLVLGLVPGGSCTGAVIGIEPAKAQSELRVLWRREMVGRAYHPRWVTLKTAERSIRAIAFVMNRDHERFADDAPAEQIIHALATAEGPLGSSYAYLASTLEHLEEMGFRERALFEMKDKVDAYRRKITKA
ncbi:MAG: gamma-glutamylcyclotransferase [Geminicoccaceae bacterium]